MLIYAHIVDIIIKDILLNYYNKLEYNKNYYKLEIDM